MPRRGENIRKRADGRWEARYIKSRTSDGRAEYGYVYAKTYAEARQKKQEALAARKPERPDAHGESLGAVMLLWLNGKKSGVKPSTYANYAAIVQNHLLPAMGDLPAERLTTALVDEYVAQNLEDPQEGRAGLSAKTISDHLAVLKLIADYAREMGLLPDTVIRFHRPRLHAPAIDILPPEEQAKLESHLLTRLDSYALGVLLTLYTGLRIGELCALRFCDIDLEEGLLEVNATMLRIRPCPHAPAHRRAQDAVLQAKDPPFAVLCDGNLRAASTRGPRNGFPAHRLRAVHRTAQLLRAIPADAARGRAAAPFLPRAPAHLRHALHRKRSGPQVRQ